MGWNPSATSTLGLEWAPHIETVAPLTTSTTCAAWLVNSTVTETINKIFVPHTWAGPPAGYGKLVVDVYDLSDTGAGDTPTSTRYNPNEDKAIYNVYAPAPGSWGSTLSLGSGYTKVDDGASYSDPDWLAFPGGAYLRMAFNTAAFTGRPSAVSFDLRVFGYTGQNGKLQVVLFNGTSRVSVLGKITPPADGADWPSGFRTYRLGPFTTNPLTGVPWTSADIVSFDTGSALLVQLEAAPGSTAVSWLSMIVDSGSDKRVATGSAATQTSLPAGSQTNLPVTLAANWSKAASTQYLLVARRIDDPSGPASALVPQPVVIDGRAANPHGQGVAYSAAIDSSGLLSSIGAASATQTMPFWLGRTDNAMSADSEPYHDLALASVSAATAGTGPNQPFSGAAAVAYKKLRFLAAVGASSLPDAAMTVTVRKSSDNSQVGGTATLTVAGLASSETATFLGTLDSKNVYEITVDLASSATLAAATSYYVAFASTAAAATPWYVAYLSALASHSLTGNVTYDGSTSAAYIASATVATADIPVTLSTAPSTPASITVTNTTTTINGATIDYEAVAWVTGGALGAAFLRWDIDRSEDNGSTWSRIATISTEATITFADYESRRATAAKYRVRQVRTDGAASDWCTQSGTVTPAAYPGSWAVFTSNAAPASTVGYTPAGTGWPTEFLTAAETVFVALHDRDYQAAFRPLEERGARWAWTLQVHTSRAAPSAGHGVRVFDSLRAVARSSGSVCLHTADGERFFGALQVTAGVRDFATGNYDAQVTFTETAGSASVASL